MKILNQPKNVNFLNEIIAVLTANDNAEGHEFYLIVAYVRKSGVNRLKEAINYFNDKGGKLIATAGIDQTTTTYQGLKELKDLANELYVYHSRNFSQTFHPKVYVHLIPGQKADVFIGSSNLTFGGLFSNYEVNCHNYYNLTDEIDIEKFKNIENLIELYTDTDSPCCLRVNDDVLNKLLNGGYLGNESVIRAPANGKDAQAANGEAEEPLFGIEKFAPPPTIVIPVDDIQDRPDLPIVAEIGDGFWKKLSKFDVSLTSGPGQIIIPIRFLLLFPEFTEKQYMPSGGQQAEVYFNVYLKDEEGRSTFIQSVRAILYIPAPSHKRPNQELRFTFHNRDILLTLQEDDILIFRRTDNPDIWFEIVHVKRDTPEYDGINFVETRFGAIEI